MIRRYNNQGLDLWLRTEWCDVDSYAFSCNLGTAGLT